MTKAEILASDMPALEKVWLIAKERDDISHGAYGVVATARGDAFIYERFGATCCPLGAVLDGEEREQNYTATVAGMLRVSEAWAETFVDGFDGCNNVPAKADEFHGYAAGRELRRRFESIGVSLE